MRPVSYRSVVASCVTPPAVGPPSLRGLGRRHPTLSDISPTSAPRQPAVPADRVPAIQVFTGRKVRVDSGCRVGAGRGRAYSCRDRSWRTEGTVTAVEP